MSHIVWVGCSMST